MRFAILLMLSLFTIGAQAEIEYRSVEAVKTGKSFRDYWDNTRNFCFRAERLPTETCYQISAMGEIKLREGGAWTEATPFHAMLSDRLKAEGEKFDRIFVRYLAFGQGGEFAVHLFFVNKGVTSSASQTVFAFGSRDSGQPVIQSFSMSQPLEEIGLYLWARLQLSPAEQTDASALQRVIVNRYKPLLEIGQSVVATYLNTADLKPIGPRIP